MTGDSSLSDVARACDGTEISERTTYVISTSDVKPTTDDTTTTDDVKPTTDDTATTDDVKPSTDDTATTDAETTSGVMTTSQVEHTTTTKIDCGKMASFVDPTFENVDDGGLLTIKNEAPFTVYVYRSQAPGKTKALRTTLTSGSNFQEDPYRSDGLWLAVDADDNVITIDGKCYVIMGTEDDATYTIP